MEPSPLEIVSHTHYYRGGDVVVDASAAIAPGVVLRAAFDGAIRIGPGACVGAGVVIQAKRGCVYIEAGVSLGTGVLIVGHGHVGKDACVGPSSTLINPAIASGTVIPPCALVEEATLSHSGVPSQQRPSQSPGFSTAGFSKSEHNPVPSMPMPPRTSPPVQPRSVAPKAVDVPTVNSTAPAENNTSVVANSNNPVYGREHLNSLLSALFPHRQPLNNGDSGS